MDCFGWYDQGLKTTEMPSNSKWLECSWSLELRKMIVMISFRHAHWMPILQTLYNWYEDCHNCYWCCLGYIIYSNFIINRIAQQNKSYLCYIMKYIMKWKFWDVWTRLLRTTGRLFTKTGNLELVILVYLVILGRPVGIQN